MQARSSGFRQASVRWAGALACSLAVAAQALAAQGRGGRGGGPPAAAVDPRDFSAFWELPPDGRDRR